MPVCPSCVSEVSDKSHFCSTCGTRLNGTAGSEPGLAATVALPAHSGPPPLVSVPSSNFDEGRFLPGTLISARYRIIGQLGRGGMGEVYRANDLRLGQTVALKFLPESMTNDPGMLARFHNEVRTARQVTHPNVCRVYDIGEFERQPFLSMEYVDGEDLATLLRRIGRLPQDKAIEIARRLCAGIAAAHSQGVLHRDLKPANVMIDGRGQVIITDFGLAGLVEQLQGAEARNGTPAYMAPEQLTGKEVSTRSDIYALGLVLYEMFSGKPAHQAATLAEMLRLREESQAQDLSTLVRDIDPSVERVIQKCLEPDPRNRPASALAVAAALPGGDPLAAALAAGETPSPEMVAEAGTREGLPRTTALLCLTWVVAGLCGILWMCTQRSLAAKVNLELPPEALAVKARSLIRSLGYTGPVADRFYGLDYETDYLRYMAAHEHSPARWLLLANTRPAPIGFWYRESPRSLLAVASLGHVYTDDPPMTVSGMVNISLDPQGRMTLFRAVPPQVEESSGPAQPLDAAALFNAAGLDLARFQTVEPKWLPLATTDQRAAWTGTYPDRPEIPLRIEAASWRGKPVYFHVIGPWTLPWSMQERVSSLQDRISGITFLGLFVLTAIAAILMARQNLRAGRGDRRGALRLGIVAVGMSVIGWLFGSHHRLADDEISLFLLGISFALWQGFVLWLLYLALEPHVRRRWPQTLISWSRILSGQARDKLVGRDILIGVALGTTYDLLMGAYNIFEIRFGGALSSGTDLNSTLGFPNLIAGISTHLYAAMQSALLFFFAIFLLRLALRKQWIAAMVFTLIFVISKSLSEDHPMTVAPFFTLVFGSIVLSLMRFGLVSLITSIFVTDLVPAFVFTTDFNAWYGSPSLVVTLAIVGLAIFGFWASLQRHQHL